MACSGRRGGERGTPSTGRYGSVLISTAHKWPTAGAAEGTEGTPSTGQYGPVPIGTVHNKACSGGSGGGGERPVPVSTGRY
jgi:hypothetical protein